MNKTFALAVFSALLALPLAGQARAQDGSRQPAGGAHMSSYVTHPYHDPRSLHAQRHGTGQILGAPMLSERAGAHRKYRDGSEPHWSAGFRTRPPVR